MTYQQAMDRLNGRLSVRVANNTHLRVIDGSTVAVRLHRTDVVLIHKNGSYTLNSGGYETVTTKNRINEFCPIAGLYQQKHQWFITGGVPFYDGMKVSQKPSDIDGMSPAEILAADQS